MNTIICLYIFNKGGFCLTCNIDSQITCIFVAQTAEHHYKSTTRYSIKYCTTFVNQKQTRLANQKQIAQKIRTYKANHL